jgi:putative ABC transport system ATP-binding protein
MYKLTNVAKNFRKKDGTVTALRDVSLDIDDGEWLAIQGRTGQGKTTLLYILGTLDRPTSGSVEFNGLDLTTQSETALTRIRADSIGFIFQTFNLIPTLSALENVEAALAPMKMGTAERQRRATQALADVGLGGRLRHLPAEMSGGEQQRVGIARALVKEPKVLLADEPTGNLDEDTRDEIISLLEKLWQDHGLTLVLVTHDTSVARRAQRLATVRNGRIDVRRQAV